MERLPSMRAAWQMQMDLEAWCEGYRIERSAPPDNKLDQS